MSRKIALNSSEVGIIWQKHFLSELAVLPEILKWEPYFYEKQALFEQLLGLHISEKGITWNWDYYQEIDFQCIFPNGVRKKAQPKHNETSLCWEQVPLELDLLEVSLRSCSGDSIKLSLRRPEQSYQKFRFEKKGSFFYISPAHAPMITNNHQVVVLKLSIDGGYCLQKERFFFTDGILELPLIKLKQHNLQNGVLAVVCKTKQGLKLLDCVFFRTSELCEKPNEKERVALRQEIEEASCHQTSTDEPPLFRDWSLWPQMAQEKFAAFVDCCHRVWGSSFNKHAILGQIMSLHSTGFFRLTVLKYLNALSVPNSSLELLGSQKPFEQAVTALWPSLETSLARLREAEDKLWVIHHRTGAGLEEAVEWSAALFCARPGPKVLSRALELLPLKRRITRIFDALRPGSSTASDLNSLLQRVEETLNQSESTEWLELTFSNLLQSAIVHGELQDLLMHQPTPNSYAHSIRWEWYPAHSFIKVTLEPMASETLEIWSVSNDLKWLKVLHCIPKGKKEAYFQVSFESSFLLGLRGRTGCVALQGFDENLQHEIVTEDALFGDLLCGLRIYDKLSGLAQLQFRSMEWSEQIPTIRERIFSYQDIMEGRRFGPLHEDGKENVWYQSSVSLSDLRGEIPYQGPSKLIWCQPLLPLVKVCFQIVSFGGYSKHPYLCIKFEAGRCGNQPPMITVVHVGYQNPSENRYTVVWNEKQCAEINLRGISPQDGVYLEVCEGVETLTEAIQLSGKIEQFEEPRVTYRVESVAPICDSIDRLPPPSKADSAFISAKLKQFKISDPDHRLVRSSLLLRCPGLIDVYHQFNALDSLSSSWWDEQSLEFSVSLLASFAMYIMSPNNLACLERILPKSKMPRELFFEFSKRPQLFEGAEWFAELYPLFEEFLEHEYTLPLIPRTLFCLGAKEHQAKVERWFQMQGIQELDLWSRLFSSGCELNAIIYARVILRLDTAESHLELLVKDIATLQECILEEFDKHIEKGSELQKIVLSYRQTKEQALSPKGGQDAIQKALDSRVCFLESLRAFFVETSKQPWGKLVSSTLKSICQLLNNNQIKSALLELKKLEQDFSRPETKSVVETEATGLRPSMRAERLLLMRHLHDVHAVEQRIHEAFIWLQRLYRFQEVSVWPTNQREVLIDQAEIEEQFFELGHIFPEGIKAEKAEPLLEELGLLSTKPDVQDSILRGLEQIKDICKESDRLGVDTQLSKILDLLDKHLGSLILRQLLSSVHQAYSARLKQIESQIDAAPKHAKSSLCTIYQSLKECESAGISRLLDTVDLFEKLKEEIKLNAEPIQRWQSFWGELSPELRNQLSPCQQNFDVWIEKLNEASSTVQKELLRREKDLGDQIAAFFDATEALQQHASEKLWKERELLRLRERNQIEKQHSFVRLEQMVYAETYESLVTFDMWTRWLQNVRTKFEQVESRLQDEATGWIKEACGKIPTEQQDGFLSELFQLHQSKQWDQLAHALNASKPLAKLYAARSQVFSLELIPPLRDLLCLPFDNEAAALLHDAEYLAQNVPQLLQRPELIEQSLTKFQQANELLKQQDSNLLILRNCICEELERRCCEFLREAPNKKIEYNPLPTPPQAEMAIQWLNNIWKSLELPFLGDKVAGKRRMLSLRTSMHSATGGALLQFLQAKKLVPRTLTEDQDET